MSYAVPDAPLSLMLVAGSIGDIRGHRRTFLDGLAVFTAAPVVKGYQTAMRICALLALASAVIAIISIRSTPTAGGPRGTMGPGSDGAVGQGSDS